jgi:hypothetical protein
MVEKDPSSRDEADENVQDNSAPYSWHGGARITESV